MTDAYHLGTDEVAVYCDNKGSYRIVDETHKRTIALVKCDRLSAIDNERGLQIANAIELALNAAIPNEGELQGARALDVRGKTDPALVALAAAGRLRSVVQGRADGDAGGVQNRARAIRKIVR
jgi:hypothetical protein